jgi:hypothetical protein
VEEMHFCFAEVMLYLGTGVPYPFVRPIGSHFSKPIKFGAYLPEKLFIGSKIMAANRTDEGIRQ